jgi:ATP-dependent DNA helicase DinG
MKNGSKDVLEGISSWISMTRTGDRSELDWLADDDPNWSRLDARSDHCIGQKCTDFKSCYITRIRQKAFESDVLIINHALYFSNLALESDEIGRILPDHAVLILDEAHEIEDIAGNHFGRKLSSFQISDLCRRLYSTFQSFPEILDSIANLEKFSLQFFGSFPGSEGKFSLNLFRDSSNQVVDLRYELGGEFDLFIDALKAVYRYVDGVQLPEEEEKIYVRRLDRILEVSEEIFNRDDTGNVYWFEKSDRGVQILMTPVQLSPILRREVFEKVDSVILASATLTTQGGFEYIRNRLGLEDAEEEIVPGEFDYVRQSVLYIPVGMPQIGSGDYEESLLKEIRTIIRLTGGDAFLLFTSYRQMNFVYAELKKNEQFAILKQGEMPKTKILDVFKSTPGSVLCATSSFWQGVDVQGPALKAVVIDKLPFQVPTEPLVAARLRDLEERGEDGFNNYSVPNAIISLKQGLGRLIRSKKDYGVLAVLDSRIWERKYGLHFLNSLPNCPVTDNIGDLENFFARIVSNT